jgi:hypothetical protein
VVEAKKNDDPLDIKKKKVFEEKTSTWSMEYGFATNKQVFEEKKTCLNKILLAKSWMHQWVFDF